METTESILKEISDFVLRIDKGVIKAQEAENFFVEIVNKINIILVKDSDEQRIFDRWLNENGYIWHSTYKSGIYADEKLKNKIMNLFYKLKEIRNTNFESIGTPRILQLKLLYGDEFIDYIKDEVGVDNFLKDIFARKEAQKRDFILNDKTLQLFIKKWVSFVQKYKNLYGQDIHDKDAINRLIKEGILSDDSLYIFRCKVFKSDFELNKEFISELEKYTQILDVSDSKMELNFSQKDQSLINSKIW